MKLKPKRDVRSKLIFEKVTRSGIIGPFCLCLDTGKIDAIRQYR
jgi:hypothetical protein